jgi:hypothetical protein
MLADEMWRRFGGFGQMARVGLATGGERLRPESDAERR